jgi:membrane protease YdiL (CAAX protease family)
MLRPYLYYASTYLFFLILVCIAKLKQGLRLFDDKGFTTQLPMLFTLYIGGVILLGLTPFFVIHHGSFVFFNTESFGNGSTWITILLSGLTLIIAPRIVEKKFSKFSATAVNVFPGSSFFIAYFIVRVVFISAYECWFRGYLLTDCILHFGVVWAVIINLILYAVLHVPNGKDEVIASLPYGLLLCILCIWQGAVWPAVLIHLSLTIPYEVGILRKLKTKILQNHEHTSHWSLRLYR